MHTNHEYIIFVELDYSFFMEFAIENGRDGLFSSMGYPL